MEIKVWVWGHRKVLIIYMKYLKQLLKLCKNSVGEKLYRSTVDTAGNLGLKQCIVGESYIDED